MVAISHGREEEVEEVAATYYSEWLISIILRCLVVVATCELKLVEESVLITFV